MTKNTVSPQLFLSLNGQYCLQESCACWVPETLSKSQIEAGIFNVWKAYVCFAIVWKGIKYNVTMQSQFLTSSVFLVNVVDNIEGEDLI